MWANPPTQEEGTLVINPQKIQRLFEMFMAQVLRGENADEETLQVLLEELYDGAVKDYRPLLAAIPHLTDKIASDAAPVFAVFLKLINDIAENHTLETEVARLREITAKNRFRNLQAHKKAGFKHQEAMALVLVDAAKPSILSGAQNHIAKAGNEIATAKSQKGK